MLRNDSNPLLSKDNSFFQSSNTPNHFLENYSDTILYSSHLRYLPAILFTLGKLFQAAGQNMLGVNKTSEAYGFNENLRLGLIVTLTTINVWINVSTRATKIFEYFLLPKIYFTPDISNFKSAGKHNSINGYIVTHTIPKNNTLCVYHCSNNEYRYIKLNFTGNKILNSLKIRILALYDAKSPQSPLNFSANDLGLFTGALDHETRPDTQWLWQSNSIYYAFYFMCSFSTIFSSMTAYLSSITLTNLFHPSLPEIAKIIIGSYVVTCCTVAYVTFNLAMMQKSVTNFCQSLNDGLTTGDFGIPVKAMNRTILYSIPGIAAGAGMAYFTTTRSVHIFPGIKTAPKWLKIMIVFTNVVVSIFPSIFNFSSGCFTLLKKTYPEKTTLAILEATPQPPSTLAEYIAKILIFIDSASNALGGFIGTRDLLELMNTTHNPTISLIVLITSIVIAMSNVFLNYGMSKNGSETMIHWMNACCHSNAHPSLNKQYAFFSPSNQKYNEAYAPLTQINADPENTTEEETRYTFF